MGSQAFLFFFLCSVVQVPLFLPLVRPDRLEDGQLRDVIISYFLLLDSDSVDVLRTKILFVCLSYSAWSFGRCNNNRNCLLFIKHYHDRCFISRCFKKRKKKHDLRDTPTADFRSLRTNVL